MSDPQSPGQARPPQSRPRPQYGEYATPEEQRAAIKAPETNPHYAPPEPAEPVVPTQQPDAGWRPPVAPSHPPYPAEQRDVPDVSPFMRHPFDRFATIALLVIGLYNVISAFAGRSQMASAIDDAYRSMGLTGDYAATSLTSTVGDVIAVASLVLWIAAALLSALFIARGRVAFWIPLAAGVLASLVSGVSYLVLFLHDPTFVQYMHQLG